ncbi:MAG: ABC transporter ATP-binding protein [Coriobacteriaceae bacterium]|nr:ABC transporter ATP-binding protein [Coriobacteriaceae bacterium]
MEIVVEHLSKVLGADTVLDDISLSFHSGAVFGLRGRNGSGKTMLLRALCGLIVPTSGGILVDGEVLGEGTPQAFPEDVGVLIESPGIIRRYSGMRYLREVASIRGVASDEDIVELMMRLGLDPLSRKPIRTYSFGMRQKIGIIAALMEQPRLVLLDEPFNGLDDASVETVMQLIREARGRGALVVVASHDREELDDIADVIVHMKGGRVVHIDEGREGDSDGVEE